MFKSFLICILLCCAYFIVSFQRLCTNILAPDIMSALVIGPAALGWLGSAFHYTYAIFQIPGGYIIDRFGPRLPLVLFFGLSGGCGALIFAFAGDLATGTCGRLLTGIGMSIVTASSFKVFSGIFNNRQYMRVVSIFFAVGGLGMLFSAAPLAALNNLLGWRTIFIFFGIITFCLGLAFIFLLKTPSATPQSQHLTEQTDAGQIDRLPFTVMIANLFKSQGFLPVLFWYIFASAIFFSFASLWAAPFYEAVYKLEQKYVGLILSLGILGVIVGSPLGAFLAEKLHSKLAVIKMASILAVIGTALLCFYNPVQSMTFAIISFACVCLSGNLAASVIYALLKLHIPAGLVGLSTAVMSCSLFITTAILQMLLGFLLEHFALQNGELPYASSFLIYFAFAITSLAVSFRLKE